jgi:hypothetical protein
MKIDCLLCKTENEIGLMLKGLQANRAYKHITVCIGCMAFIELVTVYAVNRYVTEISFYNHQSKALYYI